MLLMLLLHTKMNRLRHTRNSKTFVDLMRSMIRLNLNRRNMCCRFKHSTTDSGILLHIQAFCYRFRHSATDSGDLLQSHAICYRVMRSATESCNLLQGHAICYRVMRSDTESCNLLQCHAICYSDMQSAAVSEVSLGFFFGLVATPPKRGDHVLPHSKPRIGVQHKISIWKGAMGVEKLANLNNFSLWARNKV